MAVLSNKTHDFTVAMTAAVFPKIHFAMVLGQRDGSRTNHTLPPHFKSPPPSEPPPNTASSSETPSSIWKPPPTPACTPSPSPGDTTTANAS